MPQERLGLCLTLPSCVDNHLVQQPTGSSTATATGATSAPSASASSSCAVKRFGLSDPPYENYFLSDCNSASQVVVTSPLFDSNLSVIGPRLLVRFTTQLCRQLGLTRGQIAWPAGNSGVVAFFKPNPGVNGTLAISLDPSSSTGNDLDPIFEASNSGNATVGVSGIIKLNTTSTMSLAILGSIRTIRDFTEGPSLLQPSIQSALQFTNASNGTVKISRLWLDNTTTTTLSFAPISDSVLPKINNQTIDFDAGTYAFSASYDYPQMKQLTTQSLLNPASLDLQSQSPDQVSSLSFLSYTDKLLAGAWRFLTYFGRDTMISLLLMQPILSVGEGSATEAVIGAVLERLNRTDGSAAHEETIGDYATYLHLQDNVTSTAPSYDYKMVDTDYYLPIALADYLVRNPSGEGRAPDFLAKRASVNPANAGLTYAELMLLNSEKIMSTSAPFASPQGQIQDNLIHLKEGQVVGQWRDSEFGIGGGRIPYDVNTALVPAALHAISQLSSKGFFPTHPDWADKAAQHAQIWETETLPFFQVTLKEDEARTLVQSYVDDNSLSFPSHADQINSTITFYGLALDGNNNQSLVKVMNTDDCFRLFLLNSTSVSDGDFLSQTADHILAPFPVGLRTDVGLLVANPAFGGDPIYARNFTRADYHGTVVWSWQLSMMAAGLEKQLLLCQDGGGNRPAWCGGRVYGKVVEAYNVLWDVIEDNKENLSSEVWSWTWNADEEKFETTPLGAFSSTESDVVQLWSLTFLAVRRNDGLRADG